MQFKNEMLFEKKKKRKRKFLLGQLVEQRSIVRVWCRDLDERNERASDRVQQTLLASAPTTKMQQSQFCAN